MSGSSSHQQQPHASSSGAQKQPERLQIPKLIVDFQLKNPTPLSNPYGPYFKEIDVKEILKSKQNEGEFKTSTLESKHVWQLHLGNDLGLKLDLVDQNAFLNDPFPAPLQPEDRIFAVTDTGSLHAHHGQNGRRKATGVHTEEKALPSFFRQTVYIDNDPFFQRNKNHLNQDTSSKASMNAEKVKKMNMKKDIYSGEFIEKSFSLVDQTVAKLVKENSNKKRQLLWSKPVVPETAGGEKIQRSIVEFTEDPAFSSGYQESDVVAEGEENKKRFRIEESVFFNTRRGAEGKEDNSLNITLVAPLIDEENEESNNYEWVKDYEVSMGPYHEYVIAMKDNSDQAIFFPLSTKQSVKKIALGISQPHRCIVSRSDE